MDLKLLRILAARGEMPAHEWLDNISRKFGDHTDFYTAAAFIRAGLVGINTTTGTIGEGSIQKTAQLLRQICLPVGEKFLVNRCDRLSWRDAGFEVAITADGMLKLDEADEKHRASKTNLALVILAAVLSSLLTAVFTAWIV